MPHIIVEHTAPVSRQMLDALHQNLAAQDTINLEAIKTRSINVQQGIVGDGTYTEFVHITVKLLTGRPLDLRQKMGADLKAVALEYLNPATTALSIEIAEMNPDTYVK